MTQAHSSPGRSVPMPRLVWVYFASVALVAVAFIAAFTVGTVAVFVVTDSRGLTGLPATTGTLGTAAAAAILSAVMARRGRRVGLLAGLAVGIGGAVLTAAALTLASQPLFAMVLLLAGFAGLGFANAAAQLARYAAAELVPPADRGRAVGIVVWAGTVGAVVGPNLPNLVAPSEGTPAVGDLMVGLGAVAAVMVAAFVVLALLGRRGAAPAAGPNAGPAIPDGHIATPADPRAALPTLTDVFRLPPIRIGLVTLLTAGVAMISIMTMTPIHLIEHGHGLATVGLVLSAHTLGMFALSPVSGRLADRIGPQPVIVGGFAVMVGAAVLAASAPVDGDLILAVALFLLGFGWNLAFVSGSALLARDVPQHLQIRLQGLTDSVVWASAAAASALSGVVLELTSYPLLALVGAGLALVPIALILLQRRAPASAAA